MKALPASVSALFCSDIRREVSNFRTNVGVYSQVFRTKLPHTFPTLRVQVSANFAHDNLPKSFSFRVVAGDETIFEHPAPDGFLEGLQKVDADAFPFASFRTSIGVDGLEITEESNISVIATIDGEEFVIGWLRVLRRADPLKKNEETSVADPQSTD